MDHSHFMHCCLDLAQKGRGYTGINPMVGAALVRDGELIAQGWHRGFGLEHAESNLINYLTSLRVKIAKEDILYVNLEPCSHQGKTPSCAQLIINAGIRNVVYGMLDPNPLVAGKGITMLKDAGITVIGPIDPILCKRFNRGFVSLHEKGRPWITLKKAQATDGAIAQNDGSKLCITSKQQDTWSHTYLRAKHDAILIGVETVITDNPQLTVRKSNKKLDQSNPLRLVLDPNARMPIIAKILSGKFVHGTCIVVAEDTQIPQQLQRTGARIFRIPCNKKGFDLPSLFKVLTIPSNAFNGISSILVEGGQKTWESFKRPNLYDEEIVLVGT